MFLHWLVVEACCKESVSACTLSYYGRLKTLATCPLYCAFWRTCVVQCNINNAVSLICKIKPHSPPPPEPVNFRSKAKLPRGRQRMSANRPRAHCVFASHLLLLRDLLNHILRRSQSSWACTIRPHSLSKQPTGRAIQHLPRHSDALAFLAADPADENGVWPLEPVGILSFFSDGLEALLVGLAGLLLEELVDCFLLH